MRIIEKLCSDIYFTKKMYPNIRILCHLGQWYRVKVENLKFYLGGVIWVTGLSGALGYNQVFLGFTVGMNKLH